MNLQKIISIIKNIREDAPTMSSGTTGFSGTSNATGPVAGYDPVLKFKKGNKLDYRKVPSEYKKWVKSVENK